MTPSLARRSRPLKAPSALPGFAPTLAATLVYLALIVLMPLGALIVKASALGLGGICAVAIEPRVLASLQSDVRHVARRGADRRRLRRASSPGR